MDLSKSSGNTKDFDRAWKIIRERPTAATEVLTGQTLAALPSGPFFILLGISTVIATNGLISNSAATVIGAMIVAPLMQPIGAMAYGLATTNRQLLVQATVTMCMGACFTVAIAYLATLTVGVETVGNEIIARTAPTILDLVVAIAAGTAGAFAATRQSVSNALPGVAIAVALVPPLCVVGVGLALGSNAIPEVGLVLDRRIAMGALLLFLANLAGIVFSGALVYVVQGYGRLSQALKGITVSLLIIFCLAIPLTFSLEELLTRNAVRRYLLTLRQENPEFYEKFFMRRLSVDLDGKLIRVDVEAISQRGFDFDVEKETARIRDYLSEKTKKEVEVRATLIRADVIEARARPQSPNEGR